MSEYVPTYEELKELMTYCVSAFERHAQWVHSPVPQYDCLLTDVDIPIGVWGKVLPEGHHLVTRSADGVSAAKSVDERVVCSIVPDSDYVAAIMEQARADSGEGGGPTALSGEDGIPATIEPFELAEGHYLTEVEMLVWLAIRDAYDTEDKEAMCRIFWLAYPALRKPDTEQEDTGNDAADSIDQIFEQERDGDESPDMPHLEAIAILNHISANSKVAQSLRHGEAVKYFSEGGWPVMVGEDRKTHVQTQITVELKHDEAAIQTSEEIDAEDVAILDAITTLRYYGNTVISPGQIAKAMGYIPTKEIQLEIHGRVLHLMGVLGHIDWTNQAHDWNIHNPETGLPYDKAEIIENLLSLTVFDGTDTKGNRDIRYKVISYPITYVHSQLVNQVVEWPQELLSLAPIDQYGNKKTRITREQKKIMRAVLWYVFSLKNPKNKMQPTISYERLFMYEGYVPSSRSARQRAIMFVDSYLRALQEAGVISGYIPQVEQSRRHLQTGVQIIVEKPRKRLTERPNKAVTDTK